jgi:hypothetical protein
MKFGRLFAGVGALTAFVAVAFFYAVSPVKGFDYQDSPAVIARPGTDISDVYLFPSPVNPNNVVAVIDVYPGLPAGSSAKTFFDRSVLYTMKFDLKYASEAVGSRPVEDLVLQFSAGPSANGTQQIFFYGPATPTTLGSQTKLVNGGTASAVGYINKIFTAPTGITVFAGSRADPFFFDLTQFLNIVPDRAGGSTNPSCLPVIGNAGCPQGFNNPGTDFFADSNVLSIVAEIPKSILQQQNNTVVGFWATTSTVSGN